MVQPLTEMAKDLTLALIENNLIAPEDMQQRLQQIHASLCELKAREDHNLGSGEGREEHSGTQPAPKDWRKSMHIAPFGRTLKYQGLYQGPDRCAVASYVPRLITCASS